MTKLFAIPIHRACTGMVNIGAVKKMVADNKLEIRETAHNNIH